VGWESGGTDCGSSKLLANVKMIRIAQSTARMPSKI
jgi:hypothetical protein